MTSSSDTFLLVLEQRANLFKMNILVFVACACVGEFSATFCENVLNIFFRQARKHDVRLHEIYLLFIFQDRGRMFMLAFKRLLLNMTV